MMRMSEVFTVRIPRELRERMRRYQVNWSEEIREFIERRVRQLELAGTLEEVEAKARGRRTSVDSTALVREDRDSR